MTTNVWPWDSLIDKKYGLQVKLGSETVVFRISWLCSTSTIDN